MGIVPDGSGAANAQHPIGTGPYRLAQFVAGRSAGADGVRRLLRRPAEERRARAQGGPRRHDARPRAAQGLDRPRRQRPVARHRVAVPPGGAARRRDGAGHRLRLHRLEPARPGAVASGACARRSATRSIATRSSSTCGAGSRRPRSGSCRRCRGRSSAACSTFHYDPAEAKRLLDDAGFRDPDGDGPLPRFRVSLKTSTSEVYRLQAAVIQQDLAQVGIALDVRSSEFATLLGDVLKGNFQMYTLQLVGVTDPDMLRRVFHSAQQPPAGFNRVHYSNAEVDRLIDEAARAVDDTRTARVVREGAAAHRGRRALHQPLVQDERGGVPAGHPRRPAFADRRLHVPEGRLPLVAWLECARFPVMTRCCARWSPSAGGACWPRPRFAAQRYDPRLRFRTLHTTALRHLLPPGGGSARGAARAHRRGRVAAARGGPRASAAPRPRDPGRPVRTCRTAGRRRCRTT